MSIAKLAGFVLVMTTLVAGFAFYTGWRLIPPSWPFSGRAAAWGGLALMVVVWPASFLVRFTPLKGATDALSWVAYVTMGLFLLTLTFLIVRDLAWLGFRAAGVLPVDPTRREVLRDLTSGAVVALAAGGFAVGFARAVARPTVVSVTVPIVDLPPALQGLTIAQISDIHIGPTIKGAFLQEVVDVVNGIGADLVAVTGDLVDGSVEDLKDQTAPLGGLKAKHGAWFITGNHEYYSGALAWLDEVRRLGLKTLVNEHAVLEHGGERVVLAGVTDLTGHQFIEDHASDPAKAVAGAPASPLKILLAHQPRSAYEAEKLGFQLQLSGHTHGGQFFPGTLLIKLVQPFSSGLHQLGAMWIYTNSGTGYWGPPLRHTGATSEVTKLVLVRA